MAVHADRARQEVSLLVDVVGERQPLLQAVDAQDRGDDEQTADRERPATRLPPR